MRLGLFTILVSLAVVLAVVGGAHLAVGSTSERIYADAATMPDRTVVIVPGAGLKRDGTPHGFLTARLRCAHDLFTAGRVHDILVSGDGGSRSHDEANAMRRWLVAEGVPEARVHMDYAGFRTRDTMQRAARIFGVRGAVVCTQGMHAARSVYLALDAGIDAVALVAAGDDWFSTWAWLRERGAIVMAVFDVIVGTEPRFLGDPIPIAGR